MGRAYTGTYLLVQAGTRLPSPEWTLKGSGCLPTHPTSYPRLLQSAQSYVIIVITHQGGGYIIKRDPYARCAKKDPGMDGARIISPGLKTGAGGGSAFSPLQLLPCSVPWEKGALPQRSVQVHGRKWPPSLRRVLMEGCYTANYREAK